MLGDGYGQSEWVEMEREEVHLMTASVKSGFFVNYQAPDHIDDNKAESTTGRMILISLLNVATKKEMELKIVLDGQDFANLLTALLAVAHLPGCACPTHGMQVSEWMGMLGFKTTMEGNDGEKGCGHDHDNDLP